jgi:hypothetical protein
MSTARCPSLGSSADLAVYGENRQLVPMSDRRFDLVIFDCDGVLVDSEAIINRAHAQVLTACGYPMTEDELLTRFCGMSDAEMLDIIEHEWGRTLPPSYAERVGAMIEDGFGQSLVQSRALPRHSNRCDCRFVSRRAACRNRSAENSS